uniref:uncharacterized protein LOC118526928 n=1 Tax=Halichoerus grypus TaxID=9711 RepID=UPI001659E8F4|nr:uncharacterized protein LOC118526928 [Halichoerus grypus]
MKLEDPTTTRRACHLRPPSPLPAAVPVRPCDPGPGLPGGGLWRSCPRGLRRGRESGGAEGAGGGDRAADRCPSSLTLRPWVSSCPSKARSRPLTSPDLPPCRAWCGRRSPFPDRGWGVCCRAGPPEATLVASTRLLSVQGLSRRFPVPREAGKPRLSIAWLCPGVQAARDVPWLEAGSLRVGDDFLVLLRTRGAVPVPRPYAPGPWMLLRPAPGVGVRPPLAGLLSAGGRACLRGETAPRPPWF